MSALAAGLVVAWFAAVTGFAARTASRLHDRATVIGRMADAAPPGGRAVRSARAWLRAKPRGLVVGLGVACAAGAYVGGPVLAALAAAGVALAPIGVRSVRDGRAAAAYDVSLVGALDAIGRSVRSGGSLTQAITEASTAVRGAAAGDLAQVAAAISRGRGLADALGEWRDLRPRPSVRLAAGALVLAASTGGPPARVVEDVASAIRTRQQVAREAQALAAQARLSALVVGVAPIGFMGVMCLANPRNAQMLFGTGIGVACVAAGLTLDAVGALWMHRLSARVAQG